MIKNGSNTFLIGLAVYWQSCGLKRPITAAGLVSVCVFQFVWMTESDSESNMKRVLGAESSRVHLDRGFRFLDADWKKLDDIWSQCEFGSNLNVGSKWRAFSFQKDSFKTNDAHSSTHRLLRAAEKHWSQKHWRRFYLWNRITRTKCPRQHVLMSSCLHVFRLSGHFSGIFGDFSPNEAKMSKLHKRYLKIWTADSL